MGYAESIFGMTANRPQGERRLKELQAQRATFEKEYHALKKYESSMPRDWVIALT
jgi:hypothetical protein